MHPPDIINAMHRKGADLNSKIEEFAATGESKAQAEREYNIALAKRMLELKAGGLAISVAEKVAKGDALVAGLKYDMDVKEIVHDACKKSINAILAQIDILRSQLSYEKSDPSRLEYEAELRNRRGQ